MNWKSLTVGIFGGAIFVGFFLHWEIFLSTPPLVATAIIALLGWFFKRHYENYIQEIRTLKRAETLLITNLAQNSYNEDFFNSWIKSLEKNIPYQVAFRKYISMDNFDSVSDAELYNFLVKLNIGYQGLGLDLEKFYESYAISSKEMLFTNHVEEWYAMNLNTLKQTKTFKLSFSQAEEDTISAIVTLRCYYEQIRWSSFQVPRILGTKIFPFKNYKSLEQKIHTLKNEFAVRKEL